MEEKDTDMSKDLDLSELGLERKTRSDAGGVHRGSRFEGVVLRKYRLNGEFVGEYSSIREAVDDGEGKLTYAGVWNAVNGRQKSYGGFLWRCDKGSGMGLLNSGKGGEV